MGKSSYDRLNKKSNEIAILNVIRKRGPISRTKIAKVFKLSAATVTKYVNGLIQTGVVKEDGWESSTEGFRATLRRRGYNSNNNNKRNIENADNSQRHCF